MNRPNAWLAMAATILGAAAPVAGATGLKALNAAEIRSAIVGRSVSYVPPGTADTGVQEIFETDGRWHGTQYGRGPIPFGGRWTIEGDRLCVLDQSGRLQRVRNSAQLCRAVWRDQRSKALVMDYLYDHQPRTRYDFGPQQLAVSAIPVQVR